MQDLRRIAKAYFGRGSPEVQRLARNFFKSMDVDGDKSVTEEEFKNFLTQEGYQHLATTVLFKLLDMENKNALGFWEIMTLYYIIKSRRPICQQCKEFITTTYFACVECFDSPKGRYCLCLNCFELPEWFHDHDGRCQFLDNYTLDTQRELATSQQGASTSTRATISEILEEIPNSHAWTSTLPTSTSNTLAVYTPPRGNTSFAFKALQKAVRVAVAVQAVGSLCTIS